MFDSKVTGWDIVERTPYKKDVLKMLADECARQGMPLFFYYSRLDWHHPDYFPLGRTGHASKRPAKGDFNRYMDYVSDDQPAGHLTLHLSKVARDPNDTVIVIQTN